MSKQKFFGSIGITVTFEKFNSTEIEFIKVKNDFEKKIKDEFIIFLNEINKKPFKGIKIEDFYYESVSTLYDYENPFSTIDILFEYVVDHNKNKDVLKKGFSVDVHKYLEKEIKEKIFKNIKSDFDIMECEINFIESEADEVV